VAVNIWQVFASFIFANFGGSKYLASLANVILKHLVNLEKLGPFMF
jgi:hypothetical protein